MRSSESAGLSDGVWSREGNDHAMSRNLFNLLVCGWTGAGIAASAVAASTSLTWKLGWGAFILILIVSVLGTIIAMASDNPIVSLLGYAMVSIPFGLMLGPVIALYTAASVVKIFAITVGMVAGLGILGAIYPKSLEGWAPFLFGGLLLLLGGLIIVPIAAYFGADVRGAMTVLDWVGVVLFGGYVIFDFNRAQRVERTLDNSIDCALAIYLDFVNIFIRLLSLLGKKDG